MPPVPAFFHVFPPRMILLLHRLPALLRLSLSFFSCFSKLPHPLATLQQRYHYTTTIILSHQPLHLSCHPLSTLQQRYHYYGRKEEARRMELKSCDELTRRFGSKTAASNAGRAA